MSKMTQKLRHISTASESDVVRATEEQSARVANALLAVIDTITETANESSTNQGLRQRRIPLKELRGYASLLKRAGALLDKIIQERVSQLPIKPVK